MRAFGGLVRIDSPEIMMDTSIPQFYSLVNFNDFGISFVTLFILMVNNNFPVIAMMFVKLVDISFVLIYFIAFYALSTLLILNIVVAFSIDMY